MSETYPRKTLCETLFAGHTPSSVGIECKGTTKFAFLQILSGKSFGSFKSFKGNLGFREKKKPFMSENTNGEGMIGSYLLQTKC